MILELAPRHQGLLAPMMYRQQGECGGTPSSLGHSKEIGDSYGPLFDYARWVSLRNAARSQPYANCGAAAKRQRAFVHQLLRMEVGK